MKPRDISSLRGILSSFAHILSAQGIEALLSVIFFFYLAWWDAEGYGRIMYALAVGALTMKVIQFGLYYPLVNSLAETQGTQTTRLLYSVNIVKLSLLGPTLAVIAVIVIYRSFTWSMALVVFMVSLGYAAEGLAETFFAEFRFKGRQDSEAKIRSLGSICGYGYGLVTAGLGLGPVVISCFMLVSGLVRLLLGVRPSWADICAMNSFKADWRRVWEIFKAASAFAVIEFLGTLYNKTNIFFLEKAAGVKGVAIYGATYNLIDPISVLVSQQLLGWVIFPVLAKMWWHDRPRALELARAGTLWLLALAWPIVFVLFVESHFILGLIYPKEYYQAGLLQQYLVWSIPISFVHNVFLYLMMATGAERLLLVFCFLITGLNFLFNFFWVEPLGLVGGCLVLVLTKLAMGLLTFGYCQITFKFFNRRDLIFPAISITTGLAAYVILDYFVNHWLALIVALGLYGLLLIKLGPRFLGRIPTSLESGV